MPEVVTITVYKINEFDDRQSFLLVDLLSYFLMSKEPYWNPINKTDLLNEIDDWSSNCIYYNYEDSQYTEEEKQESIKDIKDTLNNLLKDFPDTFIVDANNYRFESYQAHHI